MSKDQSNIYVVILNYKNYEDTIECLSKILQSSYYNNQIVIVDNQSGNDSLKHISEWIEKEVADFGDFKPVYERFYEDEPFIKSKAKIILIQAGGNNGFACGNNIVLSKLAALDCFVFLVNPDIVISTDTLSVLYHFALSSPLRSVIGCSIMNYHTKALKYYGTVKLNHLSGTVTEIRNIGAEKIDYICGGATFFHSLALREIGLLPEDYFLYWEDAEWGYRAQKKNYILIPCVNAIVYDKGATSIGRGYLAEYYYTRNALIFHRKIGKQVSTIILSNIFFRLPKKLLLGQFNRAKAVIDGTFDFISKKYIHAAKKEINIG
jgi:GT2 family glycosyltransferase